MNPLPLCGEPTIFVLDPDPATGHLVRSVARHREVESYARAADFFRLCHPAQSGCVVFDLGLSDGDGLGLLPRLWAHNLQLPAIVLSTAPDVSTAVQAMKAGALDYLAKPVPAAILAETLDEALRYDAENRQQASLRARAARRLEQLTVGEAAVLDLLVQGMSNREVAAELGYSIRAIEVRRAKIMRKMKAHTVADLVRLALAAETAARPPCALRACAARASAEHLRAERPAATTGHTPWHGSRPPRREFIGEAVGDG